MPARSLAVAVGRASCLGLTACGYLPGSSNGVNVGYAVGFAHGKHLRVDVEDLDSNHQLVKTTITTPWHSPLLVLQSGSSVRLQAHVSGL